MVKMGEYNLLKVIKVKDMGVFMDDGGEGILMPKRFVPPGTKTGDELNVFLYHDGEGRPIATTQKPYGVLGDIVKLKAVSITPQGAFLGLGADEGSFYSEIWDDQFYQAYGRVSCKNCDGPTNRSSCRYRKAGTVFIE